VSFVLSGMIDHLINAFFTAILANQYN